MDKTAIVIGAIVAICFAYVMPEGHASAPPGATLTLGAQELTGPAPAYAVRINALNAWGIQADFCYHPLNATAPSGIAFQLYHVTQPAIDFSDPGRTTLNGPILEPISSTVMAFDPQDPGWPYGPHAWVNLPVEGTVSLYNYTRAGGGECAEVRLPLSPYGYVDVVAVAALQNAEPNASSFTLRVVGTQTISTPWTASSSNAAHFILPREMDGPTASAGDFYGPILDPVPLGWPYLYNGGIQVGGTASAHTQHAIYGSLGYLWGTSEGAYAVLGPGTVYPSCFRNGANLCPPDVAPAEQFTGGPGAYEFAHVASHATFVTGLSAFWADLPLPDGVTPP